MFKSFLQLFKQLFKSSSKPYTFSALEEIMDYRFTDRSLLELALSHRSYVNSLGQDTVTRSNERLEFLGDAVLDLVVTKYLYEQYPLEREGQLSKMKSLIVSARVLVLSAYTWKLGDFILLSHSESRSGGAQRQSILADAWEAVIGAVYLDRGYESASKLIHQTVIQNIDTILADEDLANYKSQFLEWVQGKGLGSVDYRVIEESGPEHKKSFQIAAVVQGEVRGEGSGASKKAAEQAAARDALDRWKSA